MFYYPSMSQVHKLFGSGIKKRRIELKLSQEKLAQKAGLHRTYISDIERGERNISLKNLVQLIHALDLSLSEFFSEYSLFSRDD